MRTAEKIIKLEQEIKELWRVIGDERLWHPSVIREIRRRSRMASRDYNRGRLKRAEKVLA